MSMSIIDERKGESALKFFHPVLVMICKHESGKCKMFERKNTQNSERELRTNDIQVRIQTTHIQKQAHNIPKRFRYDTIRIYNALTLLPALLRTNALAGINFLAERIKWSRFSWVLCAVVGRIAEEGRL